VKNKIAILSIKSINPKIGVGGTQAVVAWLIQSLKDDFDITFYTTDVDLDLDALNKQYGTSLNSDDFNRVVISVVNLPPKLSILKRSLLLRRLKAIFTQSHYKVIFSADKEVDLGSDVKVIQFMHGPIMGIYDKGGCTGIMCSIYYWACQLISGFSWDNLRKNTTITNSYYTASELKREYDINAEVVYPPVSPQIVSSKPWSDRTNDFVLISRISFEKRIEDAINILDKVREKYPNLALIIAGSSEGGQYEEKINKMITARSWVSYKGALSRVELAKLLNNSKYLVNTRRDEPFGMVVAEALIAGVIPFVYNDGGQIEIARDKHLVFGSNDEAVDKIILVLSQKMVQDELRQNLLVHGEKFSISAFKRDIMNIIEKQ